MAKPTQRRSEWEDHEAYIDEVKAITKFGLVVDPQGQANHVADASASHSVTGSETVDQSDLEAALDALGTKINSILTTLETFGLHKTS